MDLHLEGRTAVVTGASKGIGLATVRRLTTEGVRVAAAARTAPPELVGIPGSTAVPVDLVTTDGPAELVHRAMAALGGIDILVNNLGGVRKGIAHDEGFASIGDTEWQRALELNLLSAVRVTRAALPSIVERRGVIINISSIGARFAHPPIEYGAAKAALNNVGKALAEELGPRGVRVVTVSPGPTRTRNWEAPDGMAADLAREAGLDLEQFLAGLPERMGITTGRLAEPEETAALIAFLASPHAGNITGTDHRVDGGVLKTV
ncbi:oxidoreductase [Amycolatopsis cihanbeyliensis]|uniref:NAD(P)-dependent dehydrogenase (Short-subunit alcohol dehydrogenase family) n=1 Tax=Amycolatopsis cihanbeyliensis TaxID=1128664 RepID=A0A542DGJ1_AMYCI|nr:oxidoreductase [Amycolatopsis cihanbeyliensis]TQJ02199.1 NAD(P)-dependent dehydrogenase (short-subunit alcohol dehydrogenase family) [Amycolatopsis cihanbeyliensis]